MDGIVAGYQALNIGVSQVGTDPDLTVWHEQAQAIIKGEIARAVASQRGLDPGLAPGVAKERTRVIWSAARMRLESALQGQVEKVFGDRLRVAAKIFKKASQPDPTDPVEALRFEARIGEARRQVEALPTTERMKALLAMADKADPRTLPLMADSVVPLIQDDIRQAVEERYYAAAAGPEAAYMQATRDAVSEAEDIIRTSRVALAAAAAAAGWVGPIMDAVSATPSDLVKALPPSLVAVMTARFGQGALNEAKGNPSKLIELL